MRRSATRSRATGRALRATGTSNGDGAVVLAALRRHVRPAPEPRRADHGRHPVPAYGVRDGGASRRGLRVVADRKFHTASVASNSPSGIRRAPASGVRDRTPSRTPVVEPSAVGRDLAARGRRELHGSRARPCRRSCAGTPVRELAEPVIDHGVRDHVRDLDRTRHLRLAREERQRSGRPVRTRREVGRLHASRNTIAELFEKPVAYTRSESTQQFRSSMVEIMSRVKPTSSTRAGSTRCSIDCPTPSPAAVMKASAAVSAETPCSPGSRRRSRTPVVDEHERHGLPGQAPTPGRRARTCAATAGRDRDDAGAGNAGLAAHAPPPPSPPSGASRREERGRAVLRRCGNGLIANPPGRVLDGASLRGARRDRLGTRRNVGLRAGPRPSGRAAPR